MPGRHTETAFEAAIEHYLTASGGYVCGDRETFDAERCIAPAASSPSPGRPGPTSGRYGVAFSGE